MSRASDTFGPDKPRPGSETDGAPAAHWFHLASLQWQTGVRFWEGVAAYSGFFTAPAVKAAAAFAAHELGRGPLRNGDGLDDYLALLGVNADLALRAAIGSLDAIGAFHLHRLPEWLEALGDWASGDGGLEHLVRVARRRMEMMDAAMVRFPRAIRDIRSEYGFHFDDGGYRLADETDRFRLYQVLPVDGRRKVRQGAKPILILPPYVLGPNILAFLPRENRSFVHAFANQGYPTYIRIVKAIGDHPAVQAMTGEDDARDTRRFCETVRETHGRPATLAGYCQGGFLAMLALLSGELDGLVDALMTCVTPMDGSRSASLVDFIRRLPPRFRELDYALKPLPNGNRVVDGDLMSWVYKLRSIETDAPLVAFYRDLEMFDRPGARRRGIGKSAAAINHWLRYDPVDIPREITRLSLRSYLNPVSPDGTLPVRLFGRRLNFKRLKEKGIPYLICYAEKDNLVEAASALAPADYIEVELSSFPKGHVAIATSCLDPTAGDGVYACTNTGCDGPVEFHMKRDLESAGRPG
jgi:hypothetical protein